MNETRYKNHPKRTGKNQADNGSKWIPPKKRMAIYDRDECSCVYCERRMRPGEETRPDTRHLWTLDHLVPTELGGTNSAKNLVTACKTCNSIKSKRTIKQFLSFLESNGHDPEEVKLRLQRTVRRKLHGYQERIKK